MPWTFSCHLYMWMVCVYEYSLSCRVQCVSSCRLKWKKLKKPCWDTSLTYFMCALVLWFPSLLRPTLRHPCTSPKQTWEAPVHLVGTPGIWLQPESKHDWCIWNTWHCFLSGKVYPSTLPAVFSLRHTVMVWMLCIIPRLELLRYTLWLDNISNGQFRDLGFSPSCH